MVTTLRPRRVRRGNGTRLGLGMWSGFTVPDYAADAMPAEVTAAADKVARLRLREQELLARVHQAAQAVDAARHEDRNAFASAIDAGEPDPGPIHETAARQHAATIDRELAATTEALRRANVAYWEAANAADYRPAIAQLEEMAEALAEKVPALLSELRSAVHQYRELRSLSLALDAFPAGPTPLAYVDVADVERGLRAIADLFASAAEPRPWHLHPEDYTDDVPPTPEAA